MSHLPAGRPAAAPKPLRTQRTRRGAGLRCLGLLFVCGLLTACNKAPEAASKPPVPGAQVEGDSISFAKDSPQLGTLRIVESVLERESFVRINGRLMWDDSRTSRITSPMTGRVVDVKVMPGATVKRGDTLAVISSPEFGQAQADSRRSETDLALSERTLNRARELHEVGVIPTKELQAAEAENARARAERDRTTARERAFGASRTIDQQFRLASPIPGVIVERRVAVGQEVRSDQSSDAPLFVISDPTHLWVQLDVPEALSKEVQTGESVRMSVPALPGEVFVARVEYIADSIDPQTRTVKARAAVDNAARQLKAEMYVTAEVEVPPSKAVRVPATALFLQGDKYYVFVEESPGRFVRRALKAEEGTLGFMRVTTGLAAGERVVADGALLLQQMLNQKATAPRKGAALTPASPSARNP